MNYIKYLSISLEHKCNCRESLFTRSSDWLWLILSCLLSVSHLMWTDNLFVAGILSCCDWLEHGAILNGYLHSVCLYCMFQMQWPSPSVSSVCRRKHNIREQVSCITLLFDILLPVFHKVTQGHQRVVANRNHVLRWPCLHGDKHYSSVQLLLVNLEFNRMFC